MKMCIAALVLWAAFQGVAGAQQPPKGRAGRLVELRDHLITAFSNSTLEPKKAGKLDKSRQMLARATDRNASPKPDKKEVRKALEDINKFFQKNDQGFRAEDRAAVLDDLRQLQPVRQAKAPRQRPLRRRDVWGPPLPRRFP